MLDLKTILVCSDESTRQRLTDFLQTFGYDIVCNTQYGFNCVSEVIKNRPDLVLCDAFMYDLDACRLYEELKLMGAADDILFVVASPVTDSSFVNSVLASGVDMFTVLPTDFMSFDKKIRESYQNKLKSKETPSDPDDLEYNIRTHTKNLLHELGHGVKLHGYDYIVEAIYILITTPGSENMYTTKDLYPAIAKVYNTKPKTVERDIRFAIERSWTRGNIDLQTDIFSYTVSSDKGNPSNTDYIRTLEERVRIDLKLK
ncbi:MAG: hypothetical protein IJ408_03255 [Clostridia bacterium]|nr:hypothetical protein [Clostridia bacterium]